MAASPIPSGTRWCTDEARSLIDSLVSTYEVMAETGDAAIDFPEWKGSPGQVTRLAPSGGVPLAFLFTDFPGVLIRLGEWGVEPFPACGCDACDEKPNEVIHRMREVIESAVAGDYEERLIRGWCGKAGCRSPDTARGQVHAGSDPVRDDAWANPPRTSGNPGRGGKALSPFWREKPAPRCGFGAPKQGFTPPGR